MKKCMKCGTTYADNCTFCGIDGERLVLVTEATSTSTPNHIQNQQVSQPVASASVLAPTQNQQPLQPVEPIQVPESNQNQQASQPVASAQQPVPTQNQQPLQPEVSVQVPAPAQNRQSPQQVKADQRQDAATNPYNNGMTVIEKTVVGVLIGIIVLAIVLGILFVTGVLGGK